jgi:hypothetical protein
MSYVLKTIFITFYLFLLRILAFSCISYISTIKTTKFKSFVEVYPIEGNPIDPIEAYPIGKGVVEVSGCSPAMNFLENQDITSFCHYSMTFFFYIAM